MAKFSQKLLRVYFLWVELNLIRNTFSFNLDEYLSPSAKADAKAIVDSKLDPKTIAKILPFRSQQACQEINQAVASINEGGTLVDSSSYVPMIMSSPYQDLLFALVSDPTRVFSKYMGYYLYHMDETFIIMIYTQIDDRENFKKTFDHQHYFCFDDARRMQKHPFANALKVWAERNRGSNSECPSEKTCEFGKSLFKDKNNWNANKWNNNRDKLELALIKLKEDDSKNIISCYGKESEGSQQPDIQQDIKNHVKNDDLINLYTTLVRYIMDPNDYLAEKLHDYCDGRDGWTMWIIVVTRYRANTRSLDKSFQKRYKGVTLKAYLDTCKIKDPVFKDMLKTLVDPDSEHQRQPPPP